MTLRTKTLTAIAALTISAGGFAMAQDAAPAGQEPATEAQAAEDTGAAPAVDTANGADEAVSEAADEAATEDSAAEEEPAAGETTADTAAEEPAAEAGDDAAAEAEPAAEEAPAAASHEGGHIEDISFSFEGPFGKYDQFQLQRGLQIYTEVCSACHGMKFVPIRTLSDEGGPGLPEDQVRAYAANLMPIVDAETGEERPRLPTDHFPAVSGMGMGPDLSLMAKARAGFHGPQGTGINQLLRGIGGPEYIHAILTGYTGETMEQAGTTLYENTAFPGGWIGMPPPLMDDSVTYEDGTEATLDQLATDVAAYLMWTAEPKLMARKQVGFVAVLFLILTSVLLYVTNKRLWAPIKGKQPKAS